MTTGSAVRVSSGVPLSPNKAWLRALELTAPIAQQTERILSTVIEEWAEKSGDAPALLSDGECFTYRELAGRANQYTRWALRQGLGKGDSVCLMMRNRPEYMAIWLGISRSGCAVALLNTNLSDASLAHCVESVAPKHVIASAELAERIHTSTANIWVHGTTDEMAGYSNLPLADGERRPVSIYDRALYIYTSGTTGLPKAANISHARLMQWSHWFAGMMNTSPSDRLYNCLPMYHSVGGVLATGAVLVAGGSAVIRESFSASQFWNDVVRWDCTLFQYIGELCRYLLHTSANQAEAQHRIRMCCGNGLRGDVWEAFQTRFRIPHILEFYAATEGNVSLFNVEGKPGALGRTPAYLAHRFPAALVRFDIDAGEVVRNGEGFCIPCATDEIGEALGKIDLAANPGNLFEGYAGEAHATNQKLLRDVFAKGDAWFRTGDLMRKDAQGYYYFCDRVGDTFRWKGENVSTQEVAEAICSFPGVAQANVYGVTVPGHDGRAGMAALVTTDHFDLAALEKHLSNRLPPYAQPLFLRLNREMELTATFKFIKSAFVKEGFDPAQIRDTIYFNDRTRGVYVRLDAELHRRILAGEIRL